MNSFENSPTNNKTRSETSGGSYDTRQKVMNEVPSFNSPERAANKAEKVAELSDHDAMDKLFKTLNAEHKEYLQTGGIKEYGGSLNREDLRIDSHGDALDDQMNMLNEAYNKLNDPEEYGGDTDFSLTSVIALMVVDKIWESQKYEDEHGRSDPHTEELERSYTIASDLLDRFIATKIGSEPKTLTINRPYIRKETTDTVVERDGDDDMRMEEMPADKSEEQIESERAGRVKIDNEMQARMEAYWAEKRANEQKQQDQSAEQSSDSKESDDYIYSPDGLEYRNINKIDISTDQGKYEWLDGLLENGTTSQQAEIERLQYEGFDDADDEMIEAKTRLRSTERQQKILMNEVSLNEGDNILDMLRKKYTEYATRLNDITSNGSATEQAIDSAYEGYSAISNLLSLMESETTRRDPNYFGEKEIASLLENNVAEASKIAESTYVDQVFGEDGYIHKLPEGEKMPTTATEDAEIDLRNTKQEAETFGQIFNSYNEALDYQAPPVIKKADFSPKITEYIDGHTAEINRLLQESRTIPKDSPEYAENSASRRKLASERSAARRLMAKYFVTSEYFTNNSSTEAGVGETAINEPEEKTKPEAPIEDTTANNPPMSYHFESGLVDGEATVTVGQEIPDEWLRPRIYGENTPITINRPPLVENYLTQALNIEFNKLSEDARKNYSYADIAKAIEEEVVRTKRFPDIPAIFKHDTSDDGIKMEEMPAGKSEEQIERENTSRVKIDNVMQARMEAYWAEKRANEQKQREEQERVQKEQEDEMEMEM